MAFLVLKMWDFQEKSGSNLGQRLFKNFSYSAVWTATSHLPPPHGH